MKQRPADIGLIVYVFCVFQISRFLNFIFSNFDTLLQNTQEAIGRAKQGPNGWFQTAKKCSGIIRADLTT